MSRKIKNGLRVPNERDRAMHRMYEGGATLQAIGDAFGVTRERVRQIVLLCFGAKGGTCIRLFNKRFLEAYLKQKDRRARTKAHRTEVFNKIFRCHEEIIHQLNGKPFNWSERRGVAYSPVIEYLNQYFSARSRGIAWDLSLTEWWNIWKESGKYPLRGRGKEGYTMARYGDSGPYAPDNVYICTVSQNFKDARIYKTDAELAEWRAKQRKTVTERWAERHLSLAATA